MRRALMAGLVLAVALGSRLAPGASAEERTAAAGSSLRIVDDGQWMSVLQGPQLLLRYRYGGTSHKPYVDVLTSARGVNVLRDAPADHLHHHGWMLAFMVEGVNFWEEPAGAGRQLHQGWRSVRVATRPGDHGECAELTQLLHWKTDQGQRLLDEQRLLRVAAAVDDAPRLVTWQSTLTLPEGSSGVTLSGAAYHGLGARFLEAMDRGGRFLNSTGGTQVDGTNGMRAGWCAYMAEPSAGQPVTVAMFDSPANQRHPARWFTMEQPFAYLSASLSGDTDPWRLAAGDRVTLIYAMALFDGAVTPTAIETVYSRWKASAVDTALLDNKVPIPVSPAERSENSREEG